MYVHGVSAGGRVEVPARIVVHARGCAGGPFPVRGRRSTAHALPPHGLSPAQLHHSLRYTFIRHAAARLYNHPGIPTLLGSGWVGS